MWNSSVVNTVVLGPCKVVRFKMIQEKQHDLTSIATQALYVALKKVITAIAVSIDENIFQSVKW